MMDFLIRVIGEGRFIRLFSTILGIELFSYQADVGGSQTSTFDTKKIHFCSLVAFHHDLLHSVFLDYLENGFFSGWGIDL